MDDDYSLSDIEFACRSLAEVDSRFAQDPVWNSAPDALQALCRRLGELPCLLMHGNQVCSSESRLRAVGFVAVYLKVAFRILESDGSSKIPANVRAEVYDALGKSFIHHTSPVDDRMLEELLGFITRGMRDSFRTVRLAAGRTLVNVVKLVQSLTDRSADLLVAIFQRVSALFKHSDTRIRETTVITVGLIGKVSIGVALQETVCALVSQACENNPIIKGSAVLQLHALVKRHGKTAYSLTAPYMHRIAPYLIRRLRSHPQGVHEFSRFLSVTQQEFIKLTLQHTLPRLYADGDLRAIEAVASDIGCHAAMLILDQAHHILAHAFMLQGIGHTNKTINLILHVLNSANPRSPVGISTLLDTCNVLLLTEIVVCLGDEDADIVEAASQGLRKVARAYKSPRSQPSNDPDEQCLAFLKEHMLGIISNLNDMLQEIRGKRSVDSKRQILRSFGGFARQIGPAIANVAPQIMATLQTMVVIPQFSDAALQSWHTFLATLEPGDIGPNVGPTSASFVASWSLFSERGRQAAKQCLDYMVIIRGEELGSHLAEVADLGTIPELAESNAVLAQLRSTWTPQHRLTSLLQRLESESLVVATQAGVELKAFLLEGDQEYIRSLTFGDVFDPLVGHIIPALYYAACRDDERAEALRDLAFDCIGIVGAIDPDRFELRVNDHRMIMLSNFTDETESALFALHLIRDVLVGAFRSTSDISYQPYLAYAIQQLLSFCQFTTALVGTGRSNSVPIKVRNRWNSLPKDVHTTVAPLLASQFTADSTAYKPPAYPIYHSKTTYREWVQTWTNDLIRKASGDEAKKIFGAFIGIVRDNDVSIARHLLPHLVLHILSSGNPDHTEAIRTELLVVLEDQVAPDSTSSPDKKLYSAQTVFMLLDHLNKWILAARQEVMKRQKSNNSILDTDVSLRLPCVESVVEVIDQGLMIKAAFQCKDYARALMNLEQQLTVQRLRDEEKKREAPDDTSRREIEAKSYQDHQDQYERLHELYSYLDEPDGMEGVSTLILSPSLEHQIREYESTGNWTSAQSCWEVQLQYEPDNLDYHLGLLRSLRNLGHYDTLRTHVMGVLTKHPDWSAHLVGYQVESEWMVGHWDNVQTLVDQAEARPAPIFLAQVLLAMRTGDEVRVKASLSEARRVLGAPITASGLNGYRRSYDAVVNLHLVHELKIINGIVKEIREGPSGATQGSQKSFDKLLQHLSARFDLTLPTFRIREPILNMRRTAFNLSGSHSGVVKDAIGKWWLTSSKIARKAGHTQTAYSAILQAQRCNTEFSFVEGARLIRARGDPLRALQELEKSMRLSGFSLGETRDERRDRDRAVDLAVGPDKLRTRAKVHILRARYMSDTERFEDSRVFKEYKRATETLAKWESAQFHLGQFQDDCFKALPENEKRTRGLRMNLQTARSFTLAIKYGSKYIYQTLPRVLTIWLDLAETDGTDVATIFHKINEDARRLVRDVPVWKWYTAFPQVVSRIGIRNQAAYEVLATLLQNAIQEYPKQALWLFTAVAKSTSKQRSDRSKAILNALRTCRRNNVSSLISTMTNMTTELLKLSKLDVSDRKPLNLSRVCGDLQRLIPSQVIIPLQESLTASVPPTSSSDAQHHPFPLNAPTFVRIHDEIEVMTSMAKPKKLTIQGSDGKIYTFLAKKDDLRKDSRLMDFNAILNKLLKSDSDSRRRQLHIRTYGVVSLNEVAGLIQWVPNTIPIRPVILKLYARRGIPAWSPSLKETVDKIKAETDNVRAAKLFVDRILGEYPPVMHEWFIETFPEPSVWLASRTAYSRTSAVMSMVGYILGLGDRHCENILLDTGCGDAIHVDFDCLFEKGQALETPEIVPFRLTQNIVDGFGVTGVEGVFRIACEVTLRLLRENKDCLMNVLDAFVHDPLVEWEDKLRRMSRGNKLVDMRTVSQDALAPIEEKLRGIFKHFKSSPGKQLSVSNHVQSLILQASDNANLARMYIGWASYH
ncbi:hypothetical protein C8Q79DRAFT_901502 [Trametes meyenii]|nr:hypothetical protein C8Q79DRAFT_901502 [Trametes meyenii]